MKTAHKNSCLVLLFFLFTNTFCKKFADPGLPYKQLVNPTPFENDATAIATVTGIYEEMMRTGNQFMNSSTTLLCGLYADELYYYTPTNKDEFLNNEITVANHANLTSHFWGPAYKYIYTSNLILEQLAASKTLSDNVRVTLSGEAKFVRAFCYFYLVNLFGDVPLILGSNFHVNATLPRTAPVKIYEQIIKDLNEAATDLQNEREPFDKTRPTKWAVKALLSRVYLYIGNWPLAEQISEEVIQSGNYQIESTPATVFHRTSKEAIWQLVPVNPFYNTWEGNYILPATGNTAATYLIRDFLFNSFEPSDQRKTNWIGTRSYLNKLVYYPSKYKVFGNNAPITEYYILLRLAEQYLIHAESCIRQGKLTSALDDINAIRKRAGLKDTIFSTAENGINLLLKERQHEFFAEWGHRWLDLKRTGKADPVLHALKPATWQVTDTLFPIPQDQIMANPALTQNKGY